MKWATAAVLMLVCCSRLAFAAPITVTDDFGGQVNLPAPASRIVSLSPGATEMLFAAGAGDQIVATVEFSDEPPAAQKITRIGDSVAIDIERLIALRPDVVIIWPGGNNAAQVQKVERLRIPTFRHRVDTLEQLPDSVRRLGELAGTQPIANAAADEIERKLNALRSRYEQRSKVRVLMQVWNRPIYTVGGKQLISDALRVCGARNIFEDLSELSPSVEIEAIIARDPDLIIAAGKPTVAAEWAEGWRKFPSLRAVRHGNVVIFEDQRLSRLGPSVVDATKLLCETVEAARKRERRVELTRRTAG